MPVQPTYPGVYIEEIPSGVRTITGVSTSIAAFIGYFKRGPMDEAVQIFNFGDFEREFGGLHPKSEASYAIQQFFLNGGTQAYVVRVASDAETSGDSPLSSASVNIGDTATFSASSLQLEAINEGNWGNNIRIHIDHSTSEADTFNLTATEYDDSGTIAMRQEVFRNLSVGSGTTRRVEKVLNDSDTGSKIIRVTNDPTDLPAANGTFSGEHTTSGYDGPPQVMLDDTNPVMDVTFTTHTTATTATIQLELPELASGETHYLLTTVADALENAIKSAVPENPLFANARVSVVGSRLEILAGPGSPECIISFDSITSDSSADDLLLTDSSGVAANLQQYGLGIPYMNVGAQLSTISGSDGMLPDSTRLIGVENLKTGMFALEDVDLFNILCIPRTGMTSGPSSLSQSQADAVLSTAQNYCEKKRAFLIMDTPLGINDLQEIKTWMASKGNLRSKNAALYYPRVMVPDPLNEYRLRSLGACGTMAGLYARTDSNRGVWKAPAGTEAGLRNVSRVTDILSDPENGVLNPLGVNCIRNFPIYGNVSWGSRTLKGADQIASEWKYIPVRRLALFIEESLYRGTKWVVFEPNDEPLWAQIRLNIGAFMNNLFKQGAFQGISPREAYLVKCDHETTTQNDINLGIVNILVGFAPLKPAEFVIIKIQQLAGQIAS